MANTQIFRQAIGNLNTPAITRCWADLVDDLTGLRTAVKAITAKLDADAGVTDTNYAATCDPAALVTTK